MTVILIHEAETEFWASVDYYESQEPGLGVRFQHEVDQFLQRIAADPMRPRLRRKCYRRVNLSVFRHYIAYAIRAEVIWVVAICHSHRRPEYWLERTRNR
jgi:hypothetical protein